MITNNLQPTVEIKFNIVDLSAEIKGISVSEAVWSQIYLLCCTSSDTIEIKSKRFIKIPWFEFRRILYFLAKYIKKENINIVYNDYSKRLIFNHLIDISCLENAKIGTTAKFSDIKEVISETSFKRTLTKEQLRDASKLISLNHGANFSVPGAGKTSTLLAIYSILKNEKKADKLLVIAPRNAFISWEDEIRACFLESAPKVVRLTGGKEKISRMLNENPEVGLITYHQLPNMVDEVLQFLLRNQVHLVLDESHRIKRGMPGIHYSAVIKLADFVSRRDILSGTPLPQSTSDLGPQLEFLWPGGNILDDILKISDEDKRIELVNKNIKPLYTRTTKGELGLTPPIIKITNIKLGPVQKELYELLRSEAARSISGIDKESIMAFRRLGRQIIRLLQVASNPMLVTSDNSFDEEMTPVLPGTKKWKLLTEFSKYEKPAKIEYVIQRVRELSNKGQKVVVWSVFVQNIELLEKSLSDIGAVSIHGQIETGDESENDTREWRIRRFHEDPDCRVLVANPAACGEGISLHKICHYALYLDRTFNAAHYLQSVDRIHRLGLPSNAVTEVEILQADDTIDYVVDSRLKDKIIAMGEVLDDSDLCALAYDPEDIIEELPGGIDKADVKEIQKHLGITNSND